MRSTFPDELKLYNEPDDELKLYNEPDDEEDDDEIDPEAED